MRTPRALSITGFAFVTLLQCRASAQETAQPPAEAEAETTAPVTAPTPSPIAEPSPAPAPAPAPTKASREWYGLPIIAADVFSLTAIGLALQTKAAPFTFVGAGGYLLGGPIVHFAHGRVGRGFASFGLRALAPVVAGIWGVLVGVVVMGVEGKSFSRYPSNASPPAIGDRVGWAVGMLGTVVADPVLIAWKERAASPHEPLPTQPRSSLRRMPTLGIRSQQAAVGVAGEF